MGYALVPPCDIVEDRVAGLAGAGLVEDAEGLELTPKFHNSQFWAPCL